MKNDTIAAIATPVGVGGIGVIRISGEHAFEIADKVFRAADRSVTLAAAESHTLHYGHIVDLRDGSVVDEVMAAIMRAPRTFTAENVVEISTHGSPLILKKVLSLVCVAGARMAQAGEFTKRAFLNGRIDLSRAEAVLDVIHADSDISLKNAVNQLEGGLMHEIDEIREPLLYVSAQFAAAVDYPDDEIADLSEESLRETLIKTIDMCTRLLDDADLGRIVKEGIVCVLCGRPNVGKSSLLNCLTRSQRAIVTEIEGTTRDVIEESITLGGAAIRLIDTAGIRQTGDTVEKIGVDRSKSYIESSDIALVMFDGSSPITNEDIDALRLTAAKKRIIVINKSDIDMRFNAASIEDMIQNDKIIHISTKTGENIDKLKALLSDMCAVGEISAKGTLVSNMRHIEALSEAKQSLINALDTLDSGMPMDMCSIDIAAALESLGLITGVSVSADIVDKIFAEFCVGK